MRTTSRVRIDENICEDIILRYFTRIYIYAIIDFVIGDENAMVVSWRLLETLLLAYEEPKLTRFHKAVAAKIMSLDFVLPYWLESSYKVSEFERLD